MLTRDLNELLQLPTRDLKAVEQSVADVHQIAESLEVVALDGGQGLAGEHVDSPEDLVNAGPRGPPWTEGPSRHRGTAGGPQQEPCEKCGSSPNRSSSEAE